MKIVAITGSIGSGKTFLSDIIRGLGFVVYDVDKWVKYLYYKKDFIEVIYKNFPMVFDDGVFNKRKLRNYVFNDNKELKRLEALIHPFLKQKLLNIIHRNAKNDGVLFLDVALLFEMKWDKYCKAVILADVNIEVQKQRVMKRDGISAEDFVKIIRVQMSNENKKQFVDYVVNTDKKVGVLTAELIDIIKEIENA